MLDDQNFFYKQKIIRQMRKLVASYMHESPQGSGGYCHMTGLRNILRNYLLLI